jgi:hypothetical protein
VIFGGCRPVFCDHLSFEPICQREWHALGQFARHFILPLLVAEKSGLPAHAQFRMFRDGVTPQLARRMCGWRMWFSRAMPLAFAAGARDHRAAPRPRAAGGSAGSLHANLYRYCRSSLPSRASITARHQRGGDAGGTWSSYSQDRAHYAPAAIQSKQALVRGWMERLKPSWILDLGANTGEFSFLGARTGARVIAVDSDHDCIERLYLQALGQPPFDLAIHPVVAQLDDLCAGRGWRGCEAPGLLARLEARCDLVLMLGLVHHLAIAGAIPVTEIAAFAASLTRRMLIMEIVAQGDPMFEKLAAQYGRSRDAAETCGHAAQLSALVSHFEVVESHRLPDSPRTLLLLEKKSF